MTLRRSHLAVSVTNEFHLLRGADIRQQLELWPIKFIPALEGDLSFTLATESYVIHFLLLLHSFTELI